MTVEHTERKLARVVLIDSIHEIPGANNIELAMVGGWQVVVQKGLYVPNSKAIYFEIDSLLPVERPCFADLANIGSKFQFVIDGKQYARIKTVKRMKQLSQGFCVPLAEAGIEQAAKVDTDVTFQLGVLKYESEGEKVQKNGVANAKTGTTALGFPKFIPKTDQTRLQNIPVAYNQALAKGELFEKSFKLDGSSLTAFIRDGVEGVASRNVGFRVADEPIPFFTAVKNYFRGLGWKRVIKADDNAFIEMAIESGVFIAMHLDGRNLAVQGEMVGPSIQKNFEGVDKNEFYVYDIFLIDEQRYMLPAERQGFCTAYGIKHVPLGSPHAVTLPVDVAAALADAEGPSGLNGKYREGFVYKSMERDFSFKVISNAYLLKEE
jgi:RNA ligase (TIGR02306 family)